MDGSASSKVRAGSMANTYLTVCDSWSADTLISKLEEAGYGLAREGKTAEAMRVFVSVAELKNSSRVRR